jgi:hypothetical protein
VLLIGPVILGHMTRQNYLEFLQNQLPEKLENVPLSTRIAMYFEHDGAPTHYTRLVMHHPNDTFPNRWIGRGSTINRLTKISRPNAVRFFFMGLDEE